MAATKTPNAQRLFRNRNTKWKARLYKEGGLLPHALVNGEVVECRLWSGTDGASPYVLASTAGPTVNQSTITVNDAGDEGAGNPAIVTIEITMADAALVPEGAQKLELVCVLNSQASVVGTCTLNVDPSPA